jgi:hypothetical protein
MVIDSKVILTYIAIGGDIGWWTLGASCLNLTRIDNFETWLMNQFLVACVDIRALNF